MAKGTLATERGERGRVEQGQNTYVLSRPVALTPSASLLTS
jgi:hypothetical protein